MLKHLTLAALLAATAVPLAAHAQERGDEDDYRMERRDRDRDEDRDRDRDKDRDREDRAERRDDRPEPGPRDMRHGDRWARMDEPGPGPRGPRDMGPRGEGPRDMGPRGEGPRRGPPPPPMAGFMIDLGEGRRLDVRCGDEAIADCIDAARPIIDAMRAETTGTEVPPPPRSLVTPPDAGATPPPPAPPAAGTDAPTPPPAN